MSLTDDPNDPGLKEGEKENGQNKVYLVLSDEERAKGYQRPLRKSYVHVGKSVYPTHRKLTDDEKERYSEFGYVAFSPNNDPKSSIIGTYLTQKELDTFNKFAQGRAGGCGVLTTMHHTIAETYAVDPKFYGATFCMGCKKHLPVSEFFWDGTNEEVGS